MQVTNISDFDVRIFHLWRSNRNRTDINFFSTGSMDSFEKKQFQFLDFHLDSVHHMGFEVFTRATRGVVCSAVTSTRKLLSVLISVLEGCNDARRVGSVSPSCSFFSWAGRFRNQQFWMISFQVWFCRDVLGAFTLRVPSILEWSILKGGKHCVYQRIVWKSPQNVQMLPVCAWVCHDSICRPASCCQNKSPNRRDQRWRKLAPTRKPEPPGSFCPLT